MARGGCAKPSRDWPPVEGVARGEQEGLRVKGKGIGRSEGGGGGGIGIDGVRMKRAREEREMGEDECRGSRGRTMAM